MNSILSPKEKKEAFADLKTEYLFISMPFFILIFVKSYISTWHEIILLPEWSLAACIIFGQITAKVSKAIASTKFKKNEQYFGWYTAKRFFFVVISIAIYFGMLFKPTLFLGWIQGFIFLVASYFHFKDGFATKMLQKH